MEQTELDEKTVRVVTKLVTQLVREERHRQFLNEQTWRIKNTRMLLKNYDILQGYTQEVNTNIDELLREVFDKDDLKLRSIDGYKARTAKMMEYTNLMLEAYRTYASKRDERVQRRYFTLVHTYITPIKMTRMEIAERFYCTDKTIQRDEQDAIREFSLFLFGITSLEEMVS